MIRPAQSKDAQAISDIYNHYIANTVVTFEEQATSASEIEQRIAETLDQGLPWLVSEEQGSVLGYAYASRWNGRCAYRYSVEVTVYLSPEHTAQGLGSALYEALFSELKEQSMHMVIGGISLPNPASIALHEKFGMQKVAHFDEVGHKFGDWVDVGYWQGKISDRKQ